MSSNDWPMSRLTEWNVNDGLDAAWRLATLRLSLPFPGQGERVREKLVRYEVIFRVTRQLAAEEREGT